MKTKEEKIKDYNEAISTARWIEMNDYFIIDTETTGLQNQQMCQIAILKSDGTQYKSLVKPTIPISPDATRVHGITNEDVQEAPSAASVALMIPEQGMFLGYNSPFDIKTIYNSLEAIEADVPYMDKTYQGYDVMQLYSAFRGEWDEYHGNYRWFKLADACKQCGIEADHTGFHDAMFDVIMTEKLMKYIALQPLVEV